MKAAAFLLCGYVVIVFCMVFFVGEHTTINSEPNAVYEPNAEVSFVLYPPEPESSLQWTDCYGEKHTASFDDVVPVYAHRITIRPPGYDVNVPAWELVWSGYDPNNTLTIEVKE